MAIKRIFLFSVLVACLLIILNIVTVSKAMAAGGSIGVFPATGSFKQGDTIQATVTVNGGGVAFNAAMANVGVSPALSVQSLTIGDCGFAFIHTPTLTNQSFVGTILGGSKNSCTVYTLTLKALSTGTGSITLSNASVKSFKGAVDILRSLQNASYSVSQNSTSGLINSPSPTQPPTVENGIRLYTITYNVSPSESIPLLDTQVTLDSSIQAVRLADGTYQFNKVPQGVHTLTVTQKGLVLSKEIINVGGNNGVMVMGISTRKAQTAYLWLLAVAAVSLVVAIIVITLLYKMIKRRFTKVPLPTNQVKL